MSGTPLSRSTYPIARILFFFVLSALLGLQQQTFCAHEPVPSPRHKAPKRRLESVFSFSPEHQKQFAASSKKRTQRRVHRQDLDLENVDLAGFNRNGSVWWYSVFLKNYRTWYESNQEIAKLTVGELIQAKRQEQAARAILEPPQELPDVPSQIEPDCEQKEESACPDHKSTITADMAPASPEQKSSLWLECWRALLSRFWNSKDLDNLRKSND